MTARDLRAAVVGAPQEAPRADPSHTFAVVVGIDRYPGFGDLEGACNDARAFREWLVDPAGGAVPEEHVRLHLSGAARSLRRARPLKRELDRDLDELVAVSEQASASTRLYLYFAGHGIVPARSTGAGVLANAVPKRCWNLAFGAYLTWFERCKDFTEVVMFSDCCRTLSDAEAGAPLHDVCHGPSGARQARLVAHATETGALAFEGRTDDVVRGHFTAALVDGLRGSAADPVTGAVDASTLAAFLDDQVRARSGERQFPSVDMSHPPLVLADVAPPGVEVTVEVPAGPRRPLQILDGGLTVVETFASSGGRHTVRLGNGLYQLRDPAQPSPRYFPVEGAPVHVGAD